MKPTTKELIKELKARKTPEEKAVCTYYWLQGRLDVLEKELDFLNQAKMFDVIDFPDKRKELSEEIAKIKEALK